MDSVAGLVAINNGTISSCSSSGIVTGYYGSGGMVAYNYGTISNSYSSGSVTGNSGTGGLAAYNDGTISYCYSTGSVTGNNTIGGLIAENMGTISNCYSIGSVTGNTMTGGLIGDNSWGTASNSYWDTQTSGISTSEGGEGRTTDEMTWPHAANTYVGWDFVSYWAGDPLFLANEGYPYLSFQMTHRPNPAINPSPADQAVVIPLDSELIWETDYQRSGINYPTGFKLFLGSDYPPTNVFNGIDLGWAMSYNPNIPWDYSTHYYWQIVPHNQIGDALDCPVWSFTTIYNDTPYAEINVEQISFSNVWIDHSATKSFTISNLGAQSLNVSLFIGTGAFAVSTIRSDSEWSVDSGRNGLKAWSERNETSLIIAPGSESTVYVHFHPTATQNYSRNLFIETNAPNLPTQIIPLTGTGYILFADFTANPEQGDVPLTVDFINQSVAGISSCLWDFGDGGSSTEMNPSHTFNTEGVYNVTLTVWDQYFSTSITRPITVIAHPMISSEQITGHEFDKTYIGESSSLFTILLQSAGTDTLYVTDLYWQSQRSSFFHYAFDALNTPLSPGAYTDIQIHFAPLSEGVFSDVLCIVNNSENHPLLMIPFSGRGYRLQASFSADPISGDVPLVVSFTDHSTEDIVQWNWDFGDGNISEAQNPVHTFEVEGNYDVILTVSDGIHTDSTSQSIEVIAHSILATQQMDGHQFSKTYLNETSPSFEIMLQSAGTDTLIVTAAYWKSYNRNSYFHYTYDQLDVPILPGATSPIHVSFAPLTEGVFADTLCIVNNSENLPLLEIPFSGRGYKLHAMFTATPGTGDVPLTVVFTDQSTEDIIEWQWDFRDGNSSNIQTPVHIFEVEGVYPVTLTVSDGLRFDSISSSITVIAHPLLEWNEEPSFNFGTVYLSDVSSAYTISIYNSGTDSLYVENIRWKHDRPEFHFSCDHLNIPILPGDYGYVDVWFEPIVRGSFTDSLFIETNAENVPLIKVKFSGIGEYVPPKPPENVVLAMNGPHAVLSWDAVTENIYGSLFIPDYYIVSYNGSSDPVNGLYYFLALTPDLTHTHLNVGLHAEHMFYRVRAYKYYGRGILELTDQLRPGMPEEDALKILDAPQ